MSLFNFEIVERTLPVKLLPERINSLIVVTLPKDSGIQPDKWQLKRFKCQREWRILIELGTLPKIPI